MVIELYLVAEKNCEIYLRVQKIGNFGGTPNILSKSYFCLSSSSIQILVIIAGLYIFLLIYNIW